MKIETKYLDAGLKDLDQLLENNTLSQAEYIQIGLLLKIFEAVHKIEMNSRQ